MPVDDDILALHIKIDWYLIKINLKLNKLFVVGIKPYPYRCSGGISRLFIIKSQEKFLSNLSFCYFNLFKPWILVTCLIVKLRHEDIRPIFKNFGLRLLIFLLHMLHDIGLVLSFPFFFFSLFFPYLSQILPSLERFVIAEIKYKWLWDALTFIHEKEQWFTVFSNPLILKLQSAETYCFVFERLLIFIKVKISIGFLNRKIFDKLSNFEIYCYQYFSEVMSG